MFSRLTLVDWKVKPNTVFAQETWLTFPWPNYWNWVMFNAMKIYSERIYEQLYNEPTVYRKLKNNE